MTTVEDKSSRVSFYRNILSRSQAFLTELNDDDDDEHRSNSNRPSSVIERRSSVRSNKETDDQLQSTRQLCQQRLLSCSRKKLRLLSLQEQNERRHLGFKVFVDSLDEKRSSNIRRYQKELKDYLLNRLETDRLKQEVSQLSEKIERLKQEKNKYSSIIDLIKRSIPLFPHGLFESGNDGVKTLILRYQTLVEMKSSFEQRDLTREKQERRRKLQNLLLEHNTRLALLNTRISELTHQLLDLEKKESIKEEQLIYKIDLNRLTNQTLSQVLSSINYLYDRYRLSYQINKTQREPTPTEKLSIIQEFILYRIDLVQRGKQQNTLNWSTHK